LLFLFFLCIVFVANPAFSDAAFHMSFENMEKFIYQFPWVIAVLMALILLPSMIGAYVVSLNMVGAFGRIISELDEIIAGRSQKTINSRPEDSLMNDLLKRINVLIPYFVENKDKK
jgi:hypothetical protein